MHLSTQVCINLPTTPKPVMSRQTTPTGSGVDRPGGGADARGVGEAGGLADSAGWVRAEACEAEPILPKLSNLGKIDAPLSF